MVILIFTVSVMRIYGYEPFRSINFAILLQKVIFTVTEAYFYGHRLVFMV
uniref:Uncharacterized protein n=1 Tax=Arundo donax TaxID=35708 RepID=A0A0A9BZX3_ARUDO